MMNNLIQEYLRLLSEVSKSIELDVYSALDVDKNKTLKKQLRMMTLSGKVKDSAMKTYLMDMRYLSDDALVDDKIVVARDGENLVGWAFLSKRNENRYDTSVYVKSAYRNMGIGSRLLSAVKSAANAKNIVTMPYNKKTANFFKKNDLLDKNDAERYEL